MFVLHINLPKLIRSLATLILAVSSTITGDLPPNSRVTGTKFLLAASYTI